MNYLVLYIPLKFQNMIKKIKKGKGIAFQYVHEEENLDMDKSSNDNINKSIAMSTKQFSKVVKKFQRSNKYGFSNRDQNNYRKNDSDKSFVKTFKCRECERYGHYQAECPNYLKKQKRSFCTTLSDDELDGSDIEGEYNRAFVIILYKNVLWD